MRELPAWLASAAGRNGVLFFNGFSPWIQLQRAVAKLQEFTITSWGKWFFRRRPGELMIGTFGSQCSHGSCMNLIDQHRRYATDSIEWSK